MTKQYLVDIAISHFNSIHDLQKFTNFYDYELGFLEIHRKMGKEILEKSVGEISKNHRKKNFTNDCREH